MKINIGLIGLSHPHSSAHLRTLDSIDMVGKIALCDTEIENINLIGKDSDKIDNSFNCIDQLLERKDIAVVLLALPNCEYPRVINRCIEAGKHIICEKPCASSAIAFQPVISAISTTSCAFTACYVWRYNPAVIQMREWIKADALGRLTSIEMRMVTTQVGLRNPEHWLFKKNIAGGGILSWLACHWLDLLFYLSDQEVTEVSAMMATLSGELIDVEDIASVSLRLSGGAVANLYAGYLLPSGNAGYENPGYDMSIIFRGTQGNIQFSIVGNDQTLVLQSNADDWVTAPKRTINYILPAHSAYGGKHGQIFVKNFLLYAIQGKKENPVTAYDVMRVLKVIDAAYDSAKSGQVIRL